MNIFYLHSDPKTCAAMHNDKHVVKMILEYAQLLSTAHRLLDGKLVEGVSKSGRKAKRYQLFNERDSVLYAATHANHPSAVWTRQSDKNYDWLFALFQACLSEYTHRYGKVHSTARLEAWLARQPAHIPQGEFTEPTPAMPDEYKVEGNSVQSYRNYYLNDKVKMSRWTNQAMPNWFADGINTLYGDACFILRDDKRGRIISMPFNEAKNANLLIS